MAVEVSARCQSVRVEVRQRLEMFIDSLTNPAKYWVRQLPSETKSDWNSIQAAFKRKYCTDIVPPRLQYYKLTQKSDELASNYLYRLNGAALRAGLDFRDTMDPEPLEDHIQQFFDTLHDKNLQMQFRFTAFESIDELEKKILQYESTQSRPTKKVGFKKTADDGAADGTPAVNRINSDHRGGGAGSGGGARQQLQEEYKPSRPSNQQQQNLTSQSRGFTEQPNTKPRCEHCNKLGHALRFSWTPPVSSFWFTAGFITSCQLIGQVPDVRLVLGFCLISDCRCRLHNH
jgi:hypothetical protein